MITRRQFFARWRALGFKKSRLQMTRIGLTYERRDDDGEVLVVVPKYHESTFHILGDVPYSGIFVKANDRTQWGIHVRPELLEKESMLEVCLGLVSGEIVLHQWPA